MSMLEQLLSEIRAGGTLEVQSLAARLKTSPQIVTAMLDHLQRNGLISAYLNCGEGCNGCSLSEACRSHSAPTARLWQSKPEP